MLEQLQSGLASWQAQLQDLAMVGLAVFLGGLLGAERELADKPAGLRTHMLVAAAAALLVSLGDVVVSDLARETIPGAVRSDPIRILEAVITGVSFLGAGTIIRNARGKSIEGLTTAASLLFTAGVGVTVALGQLVLAVGVALLALLTLRGVGWAESRLTSDGS